MYSVVWSGEVRYYHVLHALKAQPGRYLAHPQKKAKQHNRDEHSRQTASNTSKLPGQDTDLGREDRAE